MTIKEHTAQAEYRSQADEILRRIHLNKQDLHELIQLSYNEVMRLDIEGQQIKNAKNDKKGLDNVIEQIEKFEKAGYDKAVEELKKILFDPRYLEEKMRAVDKKRPFIM